jgi:hypothetical protein
MVLGHHRLKAMAHFRNPLSERREAIAFEVYVAMIGTLLLALRWDARPRRRCALDR